MLVGRDRGAHRFDCGIVVQLGSGALAELRELLRIVTEPFSELGSRRNLLDPGAEGGVFRADAPWPDSVDENPVAIIW